MTTRLTELTSAYLAIEGLLQSPVLSESTKEQLKETLEVLNAELIRKLQCHADQDPLHKLGKTA